MSKPVIALLFAQLEFTKKGAVSHFPDGTSYGALPHDEPHYHAIAHRLGYEGDTLRYCQEHELAHHLIAEHFGMASPVLWALAHSQQPGALQVAGEEALAMALQRFVRAHEHPLVDKVDWEQVRARFLEVLE